MFCPYCGTKNPESASFCAACGASLVKAAGLLENEPTAHDASVEVSSGVPSDVPSGVSRNRRRPSAPIAIAIVIAFVGLCAFAGVSMMESSGSSSASYAKSWTPAPYMDVSLYDEPTSEIIATLEDESVSFDSLSVEGHSVFVRMRTFSTEGMFPQAKPGEYTYVQLRLSMPEGIDPAQVEAPEDIPDSSRLSAVNIFVAADLSEDELVPTSRAIIDGLGFGEPHNAIVSSEELYDEYTDEFGVPDNASEAISNDSGGIEVSMAARSDTFFPQRTGLGSWVLTCTAQDGSSSGTIRLTYMPLYSSAG